MLPHPQMSACITLPLLSNCCLFCLPFSYHQHIVAPAPCYAILSYMRCMLCHPILSFYEFWCGFLLMSVLRRLQSSGERICTPNATRESENSPETRQQGEDGLVVAEEAVLKCSCSGWTMAAKVATSRLLSSLDSQQLRYWYNLSVCQCVYLSAWRCLLLMLFLSAADAYWLLPQDVWCLMLCTSAALTPAAASLNALKIYPSCCMCVCVSLCHSWILSLCHTLTHSLTLLITCTCCYDLAKGTQDKHFSYSFSDSVSLSCVFMLYVVCCMLYVVCCLLYVVCCLLSVVCCLLSVVCCILSVVCCLLSVVCCMLYVVCCMLYVVCCMLYVVCRLSYVVCYMMYVLN